MNASTIGLVLMYIGIGIITSILFLVFLNRENARRERGERDEYIDDQPETHLPENMKNGRYATIDDAKRDKGDKWSGYRYTV